MFRDNPLDDTKLPLLHVYFSHTTSLPGKGTLHNQKKNEESTLQLICLFPLFHVHTNRPRPATLISLFIFLTHPHPPITTTSSPLLHTSIVV
jgi:hypothetical protein